MCWGVAWQMGHSRPLRGLASGLRDLAVLGLRERSVWWSVSLKVTRRVGLAQRDSSASAPAVDEAPGLIGGGIVTSISVALGGLLQEATCWSTRLSGKEVPLTQHLRDSCIPDGRSPKIEERDSQCRASKERIQASNSMIGCKANKKSSHTHSPEGIAGP